MHALHAIYKPKTILIEDKASGQQLIQELMQEGVYAIKGCKVEGDKSMRLYAQTALIENGFVYFPRQARWLADYVHELTSFPAAKYADQVDSTSQALNWFKESSQIPGLILDIRDQMTRRR